RGEAMTAARGKAPRRPGLLEPGSFAQRRVAMTRTTKLLGLLLAALGALLGYGAGTGKLPALLRGAGAEPAGAAKTAGVPGSAGGTATIDGRYLRTPPPKFGGVINLNAYQSRPWWPPRVVPPKGAPNVLLIMTDDVGFGAPSTFGGVIPTPNLDRIAKM